MKTKPAAPKNISEYIAACPRDVQKILEEVRLTIRKAAPAAEETISYQMPTFTLKGKYLVCSFQKAYWVVSSASRRCGIQRGAVGLRSS